MANLDLRRVSIARRPSVFWSTIGDSKNVGHSLIKPAWSRRQHFA